MRLREAVRIEIRAAEIAAEMIHSLSHDMTLEELVGWMRRGDGRERGSYPKSHGWQAGWLAATIYGDSIRTRHHDLLTIASPLAAVAALRSDVTFSRR